MCIHYWLQCCQHSKKSIPDLVISVAVWKSRDAAERARNVYGDSGRAVIQQSAGVRQTQVEQGWWPQEISLCEMVGLQVSCVCWVTAFTSV